MTSHDETKRIQDLVELVQKLPLEERMRWIDAQCEGNPQFRDVLRSELAEAGVAVDRPGGSGDPPKRSELPDVSDPYLNTLAQWDRTDSIQDGGTQAVPREPVSSNADASHGQPIPGWEPGRRFGDYELIEELARGGMGVVYRARQVKLNRVVALKTVKSGTFADAEETRRFLQEAEVAARLDHPHIVPVYDVGDVDGHCFYSMALVEGESLDQRVRSDGPLEPASAARIVRTVARAVHYAHESGVIHRDLKPNNVLLDHLENPRVTDFGLAKLRQTDSDLTASGQILGTLAFMPPEQAAGRIDQVDTLSDVYALGATLYYLLAARPPFQTASVAESIRQVIEMEPAGLRKLNRAIPRDLETICLKCLRKEPGSRYSSAEALAEDLDRWLAGEPVVARRVHPLERAWKWCRRRPMVAGLSVALLLLVTVGSFTFWERQQAVRAAGLIAALSVAEPDQVPGLLPQLEARRRWTRPRLYRILNGAITHSERARMHARIVLVRDDAELAPEVMADLLQADYADIENLRSALQASPASIADQLWEVALDRDNAPAETRFRAALALAAIAPGSDRWDDATCRFIAEQLVTANPVSQPELWSLLHPVRERLLAPLEELFVDDRAGELQQVSAANALVRFTADDTRLLARLLLEATAQQHQILFPAVAADAARHRRVWRELVQEPPASEMGYRERLTLGRHRATAAILLLRTGSDTDDILDVLRVTDDPESLTQFVHRSRERGVETTDLLEVLDRVETRRAGLSGDPRMLEDRVLFGLLITLGEFEVRDVPLDRRESLIDRLAHLHREDPSAAVHAATGWLLRRWDRPDLADAVDRTPVPYTPGREWFTLAVGDTSANPSAHVEAVYMTFVVLPAGTYLLGSPDDEPMRAGDEPHRYVTLTQTIGVSDRELTRAQCYPADGFPRRPMLEGDTDADDARRSANGVNWWDAIRYCRWLTAHAGYPESEQSYADPDALAEGRPSSAARCARGSAAFGFRPRPSGKLPAAPALTPCTPSETTTASSATTHVTVTTRGPGPTPSANADRICGGCSTFTETSTNGATTGMARRLSRTPSIRPVHRMDPVDRRGEACGPARPGRAGRPGATRHIPNVAPADSGFAWSAPCRKKFRPIGRLISTGREAGCSHRLKGRKWPTNCF